MTFYAVDSARQVMRLLTASLPEDDGVIVGLSVGGSGIWF